MNTENLIRMANDISAFFDSEAGADAPAHIASHITRFWVRARSDAQVLLRRGDKA